MKNRMRIRDRLDYKLFMANLEKFERGYEAAICLDDKCKHDCRKFMDAVEASASDKEMYTLIDLLILQLKKDVDKALLLFPFAYRYSLGELCRYNNLFLTIEASFIETHYLNDTITPAPNMDFTKEEIFGVCELAEKLIFTIRHLISEYICSTLDIEKESLGHEFEIISIDDRNFMYPLMNVGDDVIELALELSKLMHIYQTDLQMSINSDPAE